MPLAEKFSTLGLYNGFPSCGKLDVANAFLYAPLTLEQVSALYYNLVAAKGTATLSGDDISLAVEDTGLILDSESTEDPKEEMLPQKRVCGRSAGAGKYDFGDQIYYRVSVEVKLPLVFFKMYKGSTFIGYGFEGEVAAATANEDAGAGRVGTNYILANYCLYDPATEDIDEQTWFEQYSVLSTDGLTVSETNVSDIPFILFQYDYPIGASINASTTAEITALEFYTYP